MASRLPLGTPAAQGLLGTLESIGRLRGRLHDYRGVPVLCTYHPAYLLPGRSPIPECCVVSMVRGRACCSPRIRMLPAF